MLAGLRSPVHKSSTSGGVDFLTSRSRSSRWLGRQCGTGRTSSCGQSAPGAFLCPIRSLLDRSVVGGRGPRGADRLRRGREYRRAVLGGQVPRAWKHNIMPLRPYACPLDTNPSDSRSRIALPTVDGLQPTCFAIVERRMTRPVADGLWGRIASSTSSRLMGGRPRFGLGSVPPVAFDTVAAYSRSLAADVTAGQGAT